MLQVGSSPPPENWRDSRKVTVICDDPYHLNVKTAVLAIVEKTGRKYYYLRYVFDGKPHYWTDQKEIDKVVLLEGFQYDLVESLKKHVLATSEYQRELDSVQRQKAWELETEKRNKVADYMKQWSIDNPPPLAPTIPDA